MKNAVPQLAPPLVALLGGLLIWEGLVQTNLINPILVPPPSAVFLCLLKDRSELGQALLSTSFSVGMGFLASSLFGLVAAILLSSSTLLYKSIFPYAIFFQTVPIVAIAPLLVIWFGYGTLSVVASAFIVSVFPMIVSTLTGLQSTDPAMRDLFRLYQASRMQTLFKLTLPFALPHLFNGLRIVGGLAVIGAIVGEFIGGTGLGSVVDVARTQQRIDKVFAAVLLSSFLGLVIVGIVGLANRFCLHRWRHY